METSLRPTSASYEEITFLGCYLALKARKEKYAAFDFEKYRKILSCVCEDCKRWKNISEETLKPLGLKNEFNNSRIENLINESGNEFLYASTGKIYDFCSKEIIPCDNDRYFLLITICLNNFSDDKVKKLLAHQLSLYPDKAEFLEQMKITVRQHAKKIIAKSKAETALEWIETQTKQTDVQKNTDTDLASVEQKENDIVNPPPPEGFKKIPGNLTDEQIAHFFSFLHEEKGNDGNPLLPKNDVNELLQHGFGFGNAPSGKYYTLNISPYQKGLIQYCFHKLLESHEDKKQADIRELILQFLIFNFEQFKPEDGRDYLEHHKTFSKNFTWSKPKKMKFDIMPYLSKKSF